MLRKLLVVGMSTVMAFVVSACSKYEDQPEAGAVNIEVDESYDDSYDGSYSESAVDSGVLDELSQAYIDQRIGGRVYFALNRYNVDSAGAAQLQEQARWMMDNPGVNVTIAGHCDERGTREYNLALGARRANSVRDFLVAQGINGNRVDTVSYGKERPAVVGSNEAAYAANRRSVTVLSP